MKKIRRTPLVRFKKRRLFREPEEWFVEREEAVLVVRSKLHLCSFEKGTTENSGSCGSFRSETNHCCFKKRKETVGFKEKKRKRKETVGFKEKKRTAQKRRPWFVSARNYRKQGFLGFFEKQDEQHLFLNEPQEPLFVCLEQHHKNGAVPSKKTRRRRPRC